MSTSMFAQAPTMSASIEQGRSLFNKAAPVKAAPTMSVSMFASKNRLALLDMMFESDTKYDVDDFKKCLGDHFDHTQLLTVCVDNDLCDLSTGEMEDLSSDEIMRFIDHACGQESEKNSMFCLHKDLLIDMMMEGSEEKEVKYGPEDFKNALDDGCFDEDEFEKIAGGDDISQDQILRHLYLTKHGVQKNLSEGLSALLSEQPNETPAVYQFLADHFQKLAGGFRTPAQKTIVKQTKLICDKITGLKKEITGLKKELKQEIANAAPSGNASGSVAREPTPVSEPEESEDMGFSLFD